MEQARLQILDPIIGARVRFHRGPGCHWRTGKVTGIASDNEYKVVEIETGRKGRDFYGRTLTIASSNIRSAS